VENTLAINIRVCKTNRQQIVTGARL